MSGLSEAERETLKVALYGNRAEKLTLEGGPICDAVERIIAARGVETRVWDEALRWVRQQAGVTSPEYVIDRIDRAEPFNPYRAALTTPDAES